MSFGEHFLGRATLARDQKSLPGAAGLNVNIRDPCTIRRPARQVGDNWRVGQLQAIAAVNATAPERVLRVGNVSDPLGVAGKIEFSGRNSRKKRHKLMRLGIVADEFGAILYRVDKKSLTIRAGRQVHEG